LSVAVLFFLVIELLHRIVDVRYLVLGIGVPGQIFAHAFVGEFAAVRPILRLSLHLAVPFL
jgi:hypothetical protein